MLVSAVPGVHLRLLLIRYLKLFVFFFVRAPSLNISVTLDQKIGQADVLSDTETRI